MPGSATHSFTEPEAFRASLGLLGMRVLVAMPAHFSARLTQAMLPHLHLLRVAEALPRIAYLSLPPETVCISFPTHPDPPPVWAGEEVRFGDIMFHGREERLHQWTRGPSRWGVVSLDAGFFARYGKAHYEIDMVPAARSRVLRPTAAARARLLRLHDQAGRVVETRPAIIEHPEAARSLEQDLIHALVECLAQAHWPEDSPARRQRAGIMERFEDELAARPCRSVRMAELCAAVGVSERSLRSSCRQFVGMGPARYVSLRRLVLARSALLHAGQGTMGIAEIGRLHGFTPGDRFGVAYRAAFGETPSKTLQRARSGWG